MVLCTNFCNDLLPFIDFKGIEKKPAASMDGQIAILQRGDTMGIRAQNDYGGGGGGTELLPQKRFDEIVLLEK